MDTSLPRERYQHESEEDYGEYLVDFREAAEYKALVESTKNDPRLYDYEPAACIGTKHNMLLDMIMELKAKIENK